MNNYTNKFKWNLRKPTTEIGEPYVYIIDSDKDSNLDDLIFGIHHLDCFNCFPDDWIYATIYEAFQYFEENPDRHDEDIYVDSDAYTSDLKKWSLNAYADEFIEETIDELRDVKDMSYWDILSMAQIKAKEIIYGRVLAFIEKEKLNEKA